MVAVLSDHRGKGTRAFAQRASSCIASKHWAIKKPISKPTTGVCLRFKTYLTAGFQPLNTHESHPERWEAIVAKLEGGPGG